MPRMPKVVETIKNVENITVCVYLPSLLHLPWRVLSPVFCLTRNSLIPPSLLFVYSCPFSHRAFYMLHYLLKRFLVHVLCVHQ